jgi:heme exporter protein B
LKQVFIREFRNYWGNRYEALQGLAVFVVVCALFPLGVKPSAETLTVMAPAVLWGSALLACVFGLETLYRQEIRDGWLEQVATSIWPLPLLLGIKLLMHWCFTGLPVCLASLLVGYSFGLSNQAAAVAALSLALGTPALIGLGSVAAALTANLTGGAMLSALLVLPLYVPVMVFGASAIELAQNGGESAAPLYLLGCFLLLTACLAPLASAAALRAVAE